MDKVFRVFVVAASYLAFLLAFLIGILAWLLALPWGYATAMAEQARGFSAFGFLVFKLLSFPLAVVAWPLGRVFFLIWPLAGPFVEFRKTVRARQGFLGKLLRVYFWFDPEWIEKAMSFLKLGIEEYLRMGLKGDQDEPAEQSV